MIENKIIYGTKKMKTQQVIQHIVQWLKDYLNQSELKGFTVGVSGGIDSAVTSTLASMTGAPVIALNMPIYQAKDQVSRSANHIAWLEKKFSNVTGHEVELSPALDAFKGLLPDAIQDPLTMANTRSRLRMVTLYAFAAHHRMLVAGTGNKVEDFGVGFFTKYGDGGVDVSPIADLLKSQVYAIGKEMGVIEEILTAAPTDGLWEDDRTDENQIGATYNELEWAMGQEESPQDALLTERQEKVIEIYKTFNRANRHKMDPIPVCRIPKELL